MLRAISIAVICCAAIVLAGTNLGSNLWLLAVEPVNHIPRESSLWAFDPTVINEGSSNYWIYGRDSANYYYFTGDGAGYSAISRTDADGCAGFVETDHQTWCRT